MANSQPPSSPEPVTAAQPKISQRLILRTAMLLFLMALLFWGFRVFEDQHGDYDRGGDSTGMIAAIQVKDNGQEAVLIHPDGTIVGTDNWKDGGTDRDLAWQPDGRFLFFVSDRDGGTFHLVRWNPSATTTSPMTAGSRGRSAPTFAADSPTDANDSLLMICGGDVQGFDPKKKNTPQLLPPPSATITQSTPDDDSQGGSEAEFSAMYGGLGTSFRYARYCKDNKYVAAVMEREGGEVLILQNLTLDEHGKMPKPMPVVAGDHIDFDVNPKDGTVVFTVQNFKITDLQNIPPSFIKNGKVSLPFKHAIGVVDPDKKPGLTIIGASPNDSTAFAKPAISPDGISVLLVAGRYDSSSQSFSPKQLLSSPIQYAGIQSSSRLINGDIYEPCWAPDGSKIAFAMRVNGKRDIYTAGPDGSAQINLTNGKGDFLTPTFSPAVKAGG